MTPDVMPATNRESLVLRGSEPKPQRGRWLDRKPLSEGTARSQGLALPTVRNWSSYLFNYSVSM